MLLRVVLAGFVLGMGPPVVEDPSRFAQLVADFESHELVHDPERRARDGDLAAARTWPDLSPATTRAREQAEAAFLERLRAIDPGALGPNDQVSYAVLEHILNFRVELAPFETQRAPFTNDSGFFSEPGRVASSLRLTRVAEGDAWIARLRAVPGYLQQHVDWMRRGIAEDHTQPRAIMDAVVGQVRALAAHSPEETGLLEPIDRLPTSIDSRQRDRLRAEALQAVREVVLPAYRDLLTFFEEEYVPAARAELGVSTVPRGRELYRTLVRFHTTLETTPEEVHRRGLAEVARIRAEMDEVIAETGFQGSFGEFLHYLRTDPKFYARTEEELLMRAAWLAKRADDQMPRFFRNLPRLAYGVRPVPASMAPTYTTGRYWRGDLEQGVAGGYMVNTYRLDQRPLYELPSLTVHEGVPGHHHQIALSQELEGVPAFRRRAGITAFSEGWGLYTEFLGIDMGMYDTPYDHFGRLTYEMWRACRLVVDTGIHYMGWSRQQAEDCFLENSALAPHNIHTEVTRYISWPGQALAYKTGELLIRELRARAERELGGDFDIRAFHDRILDDGAVPLSALERKMERWISDQLAEGRGRAP
jgi:uncharacterized protein (DUF885 family)